MTLSPFLLLPAGLLLLAGAWSDLKRRIIPNEVSLGLALIGLALRLFDGSWPAALGVALGIFVVMTACWRLGMVGGGDVKLLAGSVLLVPPWQVMGLLLAVSLSGGLLAAIYLGLAAIGRRRLRRGGGDDAGGPDRTAASARWASASAPGLVRRLARIEVWRARRHAGLPYGCAIALGTLLAVAGR